MSSPDSASGGRWKEPTSKEMEDHVDLYEVVYAEAQRTLDDQAAELTNIRTRSVQFLAFVGAASGFLIGAGIHPDHRNAAFYAIAICATVLSFLSILAVCLLLAPRTTPISRRVRPGYVLKTWIERDVPAPSRGEMLRELSLHFDDWRKANKVVLQRAHLLYISGVALGGTQLIVWAVLVWMHA